MIKNNEQNHKYVIEYSKSDLDYRYLSIFNTFSQYILYYKIQCYCNSNNSKDG